MTLREHSNIILHLEGGGGGGGGVLHLCNVTLLHFCLGEDYRNYKNCD